LPRGAAQRRHQVVADESRRRERRTCRRATFRPARGSQAGRITAGERRGSRPSRSRRSGRPLRRPRRAARQLAFTLTPIWTPASETSESGHVTRSLPTNPATESGGPADEPHSGRLVDHRPAGSQTGERRGSRPSRSRRSGRPLRNPVAESGGPADEPHSGRLVDHRPAGSRPEITKRLSATRRCRRLEPHSGRLAAG
jgi:hypothetical protein